MQHFRSAIDHLTTAKEDIRESIRHQDIAWLLDTSACERCARYLDAVYTSDAPNSAARQIQREDAGRLLIILAAMDAGDAFAVREALCLLGTRNVDARGRNAKDRWQKAGEARERPIGNARWYERGGHLSRMQRCLTHELSALVTRRGRVEVALETHGAVAIAKYL